MKKILIIAGLTMMVLFVGINLMAAQETSKKEIIVEDKENPEEKIDALQDIKNPDSTFAIELWADREDALYKVGDGVSFYFKTTKDCRLTLFNVGTSGKVHIFFPNKYQEDNLVKAGEVYRFPAEDAKYLFKLTGPAGTDLVKAIATIDDIPLVEPADVRTEGEVQEVTRPHSEFARDIAIALKPVEEKRWSEAEMILKVE